MKNLIFFILFFLLLASCGTYQKTSTYNRSQLNRAATVTKGVILALKDVDVEGTKSGVGSTTGAVAGGTAGSYVGGDLRGNILGAVGGAVAGGLAGAAIEKGATKDKAVEFIVQQENGQTIAIVQSNEENLQVGDKVLILRSDKVRVILDTTPE